MATVDDYVLRAKDRLRELIDIELAIVKAEAIAKLSETYHRRDPRNIDAHHVGPALDELVTAGELIQVSEPTKGGQAIATFQPAQQKLRTSRIATAAARKRALMARYNSWALGSIRHPHGLIGPAGEEAVRLAVLASSAIQPAAPNAGAVSEILGIKLPGSADSGGYMNPIVAGLPQPPVTVLIEVKNVRGWIYPNSSEIYQVLFKCLVLKRNHPSVPVVPILACRAAHMTTFWMAKQLGFVVIDMGAQFVGRQVEEGPLLEVRNELGFGDLTRLTGPSLRVRDRLRDHLPPYIQDVASVWDASTSDAEIARLITALHEPKLRSADRQVLVNEMRTANRALGRNGGW